jgi:GxxExxY protein
MQEEKPENILAKKVLDEAFRVHTELGPGLLESVYEQVLAHRLQKAGHRVDIQKPVAIEVDGLSIPDAFRTDLMIDDLLIIELKSVDQLKPVFAKQLLTYLRLSRLKLGLLINFGALRLKDGIERISNNL